MITPRPPAAGYLVFYLRRAALPPYIVCTRVCAFAGRERVVISVVICLSILSMSVGKTRSDLRVLKLTP